jgi:hypothetical protein
MQLFSTDDLVLICLERIVSLGFVFRITAWPTVKISI